MIKGSSQEVITIVNIYVFSLRPLKFIKQILTDLKGEMDSKTIIVGDFNIHLHQWTGHSDTKPIRKY